MGRRFSSQLRAATAGLLVSFPEGMVSCKLGPMLVLRPSDFDGFKYWLQYWRDSWGVEFHGDGGGCPP